MSHLDLGPCPACGSAATCFALGLPPDSWVLCPECAAYSVVTGDLRLRPMDAGEHSRMLLHVDAVIARGEMLLLIKERGS